jgi:hypothetical protein
MMIVPIYAKVSINIHSGNYADNIVRVQEAGGIEERAASRRSLFMQRSLINGLTQSLLAPIDCWISKSLNTEIVLSTACV